MTSQVPKSISATETDTDSELLASALLQIRSVAQPQSPSLEGCNSLTLPSSTSSSAKQSSTGRNLKNNEGASQSLAGIASPPSFTRNTTGMDYSPNPMATSQSVLSIPAMQAAAARLYTFPPMALRSSDAQLSAMLSPTHIMNQRAHGGLSLFGAWDYLGTQSATAGATQNASLLQPSILPSQNDPESPNARNRSDSLIRQDQVEAALRSKPQRGRKRDDLNEHERLELTRTRNREHAKTTRIRKKARYQELLEEERQLQDFRTKANLEMERRGVIIHYLKVRRRMILSLRRSETSTSSGDTVQADNTSVGPMHDLVEDMSLFVFRVGNQDFDESASPLDRMTAYDEDLLSRVEARFGTSALAFLQYDVVRGMDGVALDGASGGTAEINVTLDTNPPVTVSQGVLRFQFSRPDSSKLLSVCWWPIKDILDDSAERLNAQVSHPSVVSLDPASSSDTFATLSAGSNCSEENSARQSEESNGPGMNI